MEVTENHLFNITSEVATNAIYEASPLCKSFYFVFLCIFSRPLTIRYFLDFQVFPSQPRPTQHCCKCHQPTNHCSLLPHHPARMVSSYQYEGGVLWMQSRYTYCNMLPYQVGSSASSSFSKEFSTLFWLSPFTIKPSCSMKPSTCKYATYRHSTPSSKQGVSHTIMAQAPTGLL